VRQGGYEFRFQQNNYLKILPEDHEELIEKIMGNNGLKNKY